MMPRDFGAKRDNNNEVWGQVPCPQTCPHLGVPEDTPLMEWLKASQRDAFGGESQPRFTASFMLVYLYKSPMCRKKVLVEIDCFTTDFDRFVVLVRTIIGSEGCCRCIGQGERIEFSRVLYLS